uniref:Uncharacterized protein n=1 Tax=Salix viminalis TaxID=40686 RepID=A0A6N2LE73_SALVM
MNFILHQFNIRPVQRKGDMSGLRLKSILMTESTLRKIYVGTWTYRPHQESLRKIKAHIRGSHVRPIYDIGASLARFSQLHPSRDHNWPCNSLVTGHIHVYGCPCCDDSPLEPGGKPHVFFLSVHQYMMSPTTPVGRKRNIEIRRPASEGRKELLFVHTLPCIPDMTSEKMERGREKRRMN